MVLGTETETLPAEIGEETVLDYNDDATVSSKILLSPSEKGVLLAKAAAGDDSYCEEFADENNAVLANEKVDSKPSQGVPVNVVFPVMKEQVVPDTTKEQSKPETLTTEEVADDADVTDDGEKKIPEEPKSIERDFDKDPTILYALVQKKIWKEAVERAKSRPDEAGIWVSRREKDGRLRWRLLPLHAAVVFKASEEVIESLLTAYPDGAKLKDDQGMLPLHLAFRNGASEAVVNLLLVAHPQSVDIPDRKGRVPLTLAEAAAPPHRDVFIKALEKGPSYYAVAAVAAARANIIAEQKAIQEAMLTQARHFHEYELSEVRAEEDKKRQAVEAKVEELEKELLKTQETSQVLVDHVNALEAQLNSRSDTERFLATKIANLDEKLKQTELAAAENELTFKTEKIILTAERDDLVSKVDELQNVLASTQQKLSQSLDMHEKCDREWTARDNELTEKLRQAEIDWANSQANGAILEAQLKKRIENEHLLASQVSSLASRLAESANENKEGTKKYTQLIKELETERLAQKDKIQDLTARLKYVAKVMETMTEQQVKIVDEAIVHEGMISKALEAHAKIVQDTIAQEKELVKAKEERELMIELFGRHEKCVQDATQRRIEIMNAISLQGQCMANTKNVREGMLTCVQELGMNMFGVLQTVVEAVGVENSEDGPKEIIAPSIVLEGGHDDVKDSDVVPVVRGENWVVDSRHSPDDATMEVKIVKEVVPDATHLYVTGEEASPIVEARSDVENTTDVDFDSDRIMAAREM